MKLKHGITINGIRPEIIVAMLVIEPILKGYNQELVITSVTEGKHSKNSRYYIGLACDIRTWQLEEEGTTKAVGALLQSALGKEYYVKPESTHIHIQFNGSVNV